jgi:WD40 repeat protein
MYLLKFLNVLITSCPITIFPVTHMNTRKQQADSHAKNLAYVQLHEYFHDVTFTQNAGIAVKELSQFLTSKLSNKQWHGNFCCENYKTIFIGNIFTDELVYSIAGKTVTGINDNQIAYLDSDYCIKIYNTETRKLLNSFNQDEVIYATCTLRNGHLASGSRSGIVRTWNLKTGVMLREMKLPDDGAVFKLIELQNGTLAASSFQQVVIWNYTTGALLHTLKDGIDEHVDQLLELPNKTLCAASKTITLWNVENGTLLNTLRFKAIPRQLCLYGLSFICSSDQVYQYNMQGDLIKIIGWPKDKMINDIKYVGQDRFLIATFDGVVLWDAVSEHVIKEMKNGQVNNIVLFR